MAYWMLGLSKRMGNADVLENQGDPFIRRPGTMGQRIARTRAYLEQAVGNPKLQ